MHRYSLAIPALLSLAFVILISSLCFSQTRQTSQSPSLPPDVFAAGGSRANCNWNTGACGMLQAYLSIGGSDSRCLSPLQLGVSLERQEQQLLKGAQQSYELVKKAGDLEQQRDKVLAGVPHDCFASGGRLPNVVKPVNSPNDIPLGPYKLPTYLGDYKKVVADTIRLLIEQIPDALAFGPDNPAFQQLRAQYAKDTLLLAGFQNTKQAVQQLQNAIGNSQNAGAFNNQIRNLDADIYLNSVDMNNIRQRATSILQKAAANNPGMAVDGGVQTLLNFYFPPVQ